MRRLLTLVALPWLLAGVGSQEQSQKTYDGDKLLAIEARDETVWKDVLRVLNNNEQVSDVDVWKEPDLLTGHAHVRIPAGSLINIIRDLNRLNISHYIVIDNIQSLIDVGQRDDVPTRRLRRSENDDNVVGRYARYDEILRWMDGIATEHPDVASVISIGKSYEGRDTRLLKLGYPGKNKWRIWIDGGIHAREWIATATVISIAQQLLNETDEEREFLRNIDWYLLPVVNPDGYEYSHVMERLWRKNRRPITKHCTGVDLNRNWGYHWGGVNSANDPCSLIFRGERPESEPEVANIINFLLPRAAAFISYVSLHNYYQMVTTRWSYSYNATPHDHQELLSVAQEMGAAMTNTHGISYQAGTAPDILYPYAGGSGDWARGSANIKYSYLVELRDMGQFGFLLPASQIVPVGEEMWAGVKVVAQRVLTLHDNATVPNVIPDVTYQEDIVTRAETTQETTTTWHSTERATTTTTNADTTRVTTTTMIPNTGTVVSGSTHRVTTRGPNVHRETTQRFSVKSTTPNAVGKTKTEPVAHVSTTPHREHTTRFQRQSSKTINNEVELATTSSQSDRTQSQQALSSGQSSVTQPSPSITWTQRADEQDNHTLAQDWDNIGSGSAGYRTRCLASLAVILGVCVHPGRVLALLN